MFRFFFSMAGSAPAAVLRAASFIKLRRVIVCFGKLSPVAKESTVWPPHCPETLHNTQGSFHPHPSAAAPPWFIILLAGRSNLSAARRLKLTGGSGRRWL
jgi:hypothetical protein